MSRDRMKMTVTHRTNGGFEHLAVLACGHACRMLGLGTDIVEVHNDFYSQFMECFGMQVKYIEDPYCYISVDAIVAGLRVPPKDDYYEFQITASRWSMFKNGVLIKKDGL